MFDDIIHFVDVRVGPGIVSSHFVLRKFVFFLEIQSHFLKCRNIWRFCRILQPLLVPSGFSSWLRMNMSWRWMWCVWDRWKVLWKWDISLMLGGEWDMDRMNNCGCQCLLSCWMWRYIIYIHLYSILYISVRMFASVDMNKNYLYIYIHECFVSKGQCTHPYPFGTVPQWEYSNTFQLYIGLYSGTMGQYPKKTSKNNTLPRVQL